MNSWSQDPRGDFYSRSYSASGVSYSYVAWYACHQFQPWEWHNNCKGCGVPLTSSDLEVSSTTSSPPPPSATTLPSPPPWLHPLPKSSLNQNTGWPVRTYVNGNSLFYSCTKQQEVSAIGFRQSPAKPYKSIIPHEHTNKLMMIRWLHWQDANECHTIMAWHVL